jgi:hypothetical protein
MSNAVTNIATGCNLSISTLAAELGQTRDTVRKRLIDADVQPSGKRGGYPVYRLKDALPALLGGGSNVDPDLLDPYKRKAHYQGEHEKLKLQVERRELIPRIETEQEMAAMLKVTAECFDTLPDILERDCGLTPDTLARMEAHLDKAREELYLRLAAEDDDAGSAADECG